MFSTTTLCSRVSLRNLNVESTGALHRHQEFKLVASRSCWLDTLEGLSNQWHFQEPFSSVI
jgi:hypothetical protein